MAKKANDPLAKIDDQLSDYEASLTTQLERLADTERELKAKLRRIKVMRNAGSKQKGGRSRLPAATKSEVLQLVAAVLEVGPLSEGALKEAVADKLRDSHSLVGLSLRMKEALGTELFEVDSEGLVRLATKNATNAPKSQS